MAPGAIGPGPDQARGPMLGRCSARRTIAANDMRRRFSAPYRLAAAAWAAVQTCFIRAGVGTEVKKAQKSQ